MNKIELEYTLERFRCIGDRANEHADYLNTLMPPVAKELSLAGNALQEAANIIERLSLANSKKITAT